ncbi:MULTISPECIES: hypothetical protein [unclassified Microbacterium]
MKTKDVKRAEAEQRQAAHDALPAFDKLAKLATRPGESKRERTRILSGVA